MVKLGDRKKVVIYREGERVGNTQRMVNHYAEGEVVYIHPGRRWYTVLFNFPYGSYRESFRMIGE
jgi:hypothetical protein